MPERRAEQGRTPKILICKVALEPRAFHDSDGVYVGAYTTYVMNSQTALEYLTAIINSRLMRFLYRTLYDALAIGSGYLRFQPPQIRRLPVADSKHHSPLVTHATELVRRMQGLKARFPFAKIAHEKAVLERQMTATDRQIDQLVYELYGLTDEEIRIVEEATAK